MYLFPSCWAILQDYEFHNLTGRSRLWPPPFPSHLSLPPFLHSETRWRSSGTTYCYWHTLLFKSAWHQVTMDWNLWPSSQNNYFFLLSLSMSYILVTVTEMWLRWLPNYWTTWSIIRNGSRIFSSTPSTPADMAMEHSTFNTSLLSITWYAS